MDTWKFYAVTHALHVYCNPLGADRLDKWIDLLDLPAGAAVRDIACGKAEMLCRIVSRYGATGVGIDISPFETVNARELIAAKGLDGAIRIEQGDGAAHTVDPESIDLACCIGATWVWKGYRPTLEALLQWTRPGGLVAVGEPFFVGEPSEAYLEFSGMKREDFGTHHGNVETGVSMGLTPLYTLVSRPDEWDHYEWLQEVAVDRHATQNPDDPDLAELRTRMEHKREEYLRWGRDELGWAIYLFRKPL